MSPKEMICFLTILCLPCMIGADGVPVANRWEVKARQREVTSLQRQAYQQLAKLHYFNGSQMTQWDIVDYEFTIPKPNPMTVLRDMGIHAIPMLAEALDDNAPTKTVNHLRGISSLGSVKSTFGK